MFRSSFLSSTLLKYGLPFFTQKAKQAPQTFFHRFVHSLRTAVNHNKMKVEILPALNDNYMYLLIDEDTMEAAVVDPVNPEQVICAVRDNNCNLTKVLTTHHHSDHAGGNETLKCMMPHLQFYGGDDRIPGLTCKVCHGSIINMGCIKIECLYTPCHTRGHMCYFATKDCATPAVFTGDTLFTAGCGKFFEGNACQMYKNLNEILGCLPGETQVYSGHEYTECNLKFGLTVEPCNSSMKEKLEWVCCRRSKALPTVPSSIGEEKLINVFMRTNQPEVQCYTQKTDPIEVTASLRQCKDNFSC